MVATNFTLAAVFLVAICASGVRANDAQKQETKLEVAELPPEEIFFTGKPYCEELGAYLYRYRNYSPATSRWTTSDPSGFPDGPNSHAYAPNPISSFDFQGLLDWATFVEVMENGNQAVRHITDPQGAPPSVPTWTADYKVWKVKTNDSTRWVELWEFTGYSVSPPPSFASGIDYTHNCHGLVLTGGAYWIDGLINDMGAILTAEGYVKVEGSSPNYSEAKIALWGSSNHSAQVKTKNASEVLTVQGKDGSLKQDTPQALNEEWTSGGELSIWE